MAPPGDAELQGIDPDRLRLIGRLSLGIREYKIRSALPKTCEFLAKNPRISIEALGYGHEDPPADNPGGVPPSKMRVNIRADKDGAFQYVQEVFDACMKNGIYKTSLAATMDNPISGGGG